MEDSVTAEIQSLTPSALIELFIFDLTEIGGDIYYFHAGTNNYNLPITWQGQAYTPIPLQASGFEFTTAGQLPRPKIQVGNTTGAVTGLVLLFQDCLGATVTRKRTRARFLDAVNFPGGNANADPLAEYPDDVYFVNRKTTETPVYVEFELAAASDVAGVQIPRRQIVQNLCYWKYRGGDCGYTGTNYYDQNDNPVASAGLDVCGKRLGSCKLRFGENASLPYGGFPGAGLTTG